MTEMDTTEIENAPLIDDCDVDDSFFEDDECREHFSPTEYDRKLLDDTILAWRKYDFEYQ